MCSTVVPLRMRQKTEGRGCVFDPHEHRNEAQNWQDCPNTLHDRVPGLRPDSAGFDLLTRMLEYDPTKRITAEKALEHPYFKVRLTPKQIQSDLNETAQQ